MRKVISHGISTGGGTFDLAVDRSALTHNETKDIVKALKLIRERLSAGGIFVGVDWHSDKQTEMNNGQYEKIDEHTRIFYSGYYKGLGKVHFSNENHMRELLQNFTLLELDETVDYIKIPQEAISGGWNFVARKD